jgi:hypothetical protein
MNYLERFKAKTSQPGFVGFVGAYPYISEKSQGAQTDTEVQYKNDRLIDSVDALNNHIRDCTDHHSEKSTDSWGNQPTKPTKPPPWPPRPAELASWPIEIRQRWGELANALDDEGISFPDNERIAFEQVKGVSMTPR